MPSQSVYVPQEDQPLSAVDAAREALSPQWRASLAPTQLAAVETAQREHEGRGAEVEQEDGQEQAVQDEQAAQAGQPARAGGSAASTNGSGGAGADWRRTARTVRI